MRSFALSFLTPDEAPLTAHVDEVFEVHRAIYGDGEAVVKHAMLQILMSSPATFRERFPLRGASR